MRRDQIIQQTDNDASSSRMSAVALAYLDDPYAEYFLQGQIARRYPIINRGTYVRTSAIDRLVDRFLATRPNEQKQIVSLGAGSDTRFFRRGRSNIRYHELDFASNTAVKIAVIQRTPRLKAAITATFSSPENLSISPDETSLTSPTYNIHAVDLRNLSPDSTLRLPNLDPTIPTLLLSECCLCYVPPITTSTILSYFTTLFPTSTPLSLILYEPIRPFDSFGRTMISNLGSRGIELKTLKKYSSLGAQRERLKAAGFVSGQCGRDIESIYYGTEDSSGEWIGGAERKRVEGLEWLDEVEEWRLLGRHYCVAWGWRDGEGGGDDVFSAAWKDVRGGFTHGEAGDE